MAVDRPGRGIARPGLARSRPGKGFSESVFGWGRAVGRWFEVSLVEGFPSLPEDGALIIAEVLRDQLNALNDDIQNRATSAELDNAEAVQIEIQNCATQEEMNTRATAVGDALNQRPTLTRWMPR